jgi:hypothetical protein
MEYEDTYYCTDVLTADPKLVASGESMGSFTW